MAEFAHRSNIGLLAYSPLAGGSLTGKYLSGQEPKNARLTLHKNYFYRYTTAPATEAVRQYVEIANRHQLSPTAMALAFVNRQPFVTSSIIGATSVSQLEENCKSIDLELTEEVIEEIQQVHTQNPNPCP